MTFTAAIPSPLPVQPLGTHLDYRGNWADQVATDTRGIQRHASRWIMGAAAVFIAWGSLFPLDSAVVAEGVVQARGQNKLVQHRSGGTVLELLAVEGDTVRAGQPLMRLDPVNERAELTQLRARVAVLNATRMRLEAENRSAGSGGTGRIAAAGSGTELGPGGALLVQEQEREFDRGRGVVAAQVGALRARIAAITLRRAGQAQRIAKMERQVALLTQELASKRRLAEQGGLARSALWEFDAALLGQRGELDQVRAEQAAAADEIREAEAQMTQVRLSDQRETSVRLTEVIAEIAQLTDRIRAAGAAVGNAIIRAPVAGKLVHMKFATVGGVIAPGGEVAEIVPEASPLAIRSRVAPHDINNVRVGQLARISVSALNARLYDDLPGRVVTVGADATIDPRTGAAFFEVVTALPEVPRDDDGRRLVGPGMAGQVFIAGESRTFFSYLFRPIVDSFRHAFREA